MNWKGHEVPLNTCTVSFADRVGHTVGRPRGFLHVPAQRVSAQIAHSLR
eukprot:COSAG02_NODE_55560_length_289_cov_196.557895_1_plen_48_part_10